LRPKKAVARCKYFVVFGRERALKSEAHDETNYGPAWHRDRIRNPHCFRVFE
jgi:hypothetical protein